MREKSSIYMFIAQMPATVRMRPTWNQKPVNLFGSFKCVAGSNTLRIIIGCLPGHISRNLYWKHSSQDSSGTNVGCMYPQKWFDPLPDITCPFSPLKTINIVKCMNLGKLPLFYYLSVLWRKRYIGQHWIPFTDLFKCYSTKKLHCFYLNILQVTFRYGSWI